MNHVKKTKDTISAIFIIGLLSYVFIETEDSLTRIIVIPFILFALGVLCKNICLMLNKRKLANMFSKCYVIAFAIYWFSFLVYWDYISIMNKDYISVLFSLIPWIGGGYIILKKLMKKH